MPLSLAARYGLHRVLEGDGMFPQPTWKLDADPRISDAERGKLVHHDHGRNCISAESIQRKQPIRKICFHKILGLNG